MPLAAGSRRTRPDSPQRISVDAVEERGQRGDRLLRRLRPAARVSRVVFPDLDGWLFTGGNRIVIPSNKTELRRLLRFLDEDYYESALSQMRYVSNSKRVAD